MRRLLAAILLAACACQSVPVQDKNLVADALAEYEYHVARFAKLCPEWAVNKPGAQGPAYCHDFKLNLHNLDEALGVAGKVRSIGALPAMEKAEIQLYLSAIRGFK